MLLPVSTIFFFVHSLAFSPSLNMGDLQLFRNNFQLKNALQPRGSSGNDEFCYSFFGDCDVALDKQDLHVTHIRTLEHGVPVILTVLCTHTRA